jgi:hypothetical protein
MAVKMSTLDLLTLHSMGVEQGSHPDTLATIAEVVDSRLALETADALAQAVKRTHPSDSDIVWLADLFLETKRAV